MSVSFHKKSSSEYTSIIKEDSQREGGSLKLKLIKKIKYEQKDQKDTAIDGSHSLDNALREKFNIIETLKEKIEKLEFSEQDLISILANFRDLLKNISFSNSKFVLYYSKLYIFLNKLNTLFNMESEIKKSLHKLGLNQQSNLAILISSIFDICQNTLYNGLTQLIKAKNGKEYDKRDMIKWIMESYQQLFIYLSNFIIIIKKSLCNENILSQDINESLAKILNSAVNISYLLLGLLTKGEFSYKYRPNDQSSYVIQMNFSHLSEINSDYNISVHVTRLSSNILIKILEMSSHIANSTSPIIQSLGTKIQNAFIILATIQEPRIRDLALQNLLKLHQTTGCKLLRHVYELVTIAFNDDVESIRQTAIVLLHQVAVTYPNNRTTAPGGVSSLDLNEIRLFSLQSLNCQPGLDQMVTKEILAEKLGQNVEDTSNPSQDVTLMDDAFYKLCRVMVNDISPKVRAQAVKLLAFPHDPVHQNDQVEIRDGNNISTGPTLWPLTQGRVLLEQALDKRTLMSNMRRKRTYHERAMAGYVSGQGAAVTKDDKPLENLAQSATNTCPEISAEAGAFVHGLEDECSLVRTLTIESMAELARLNRDSMSNVNSDSGVVSPDFNNKVVDYLVDMFNDEIVEVRLKAIEALAKIGGPGGEGTTTAISFRTDQVEIILGALEDSSGDIREALRKMLGQCRVNDVSSVALLVRHLLLNLNKYPQDFYSICECFRDFGGHHSVLIQALIPDLLCTSSYGTLYFSSGESNGPALGALLGSACWDFEFDPVEPDVTEDRSYVCVLVLLLNALFNCNRENSPCFVQLPSYVLDRHYPYLRDTYPALFRNVNASSSTLLEESIFKPDLGSGVQTPTMLVSHLRDNLIRDRLLNSGINSQSSLESIMRSYTSIINDCDRLTRLLSQTHGPALDESNEKNYGLPNFTKDLASLIAIIFKIRLALIPHVYGAVHAPTQQPHAISVNELKKIKCLIFRAYYRFRGLNKGLRQQLRILKLYVLAIWTRLGRQKDVRGENNNCANDAFAQLLNDEFLQYQGDLSTFISDSRLADHYLFLTHDLGRLLMDLIEKDRANQGFGMINCAIINPPAKPSDVPRRFVAGLNLAVATEIVITSSHPISHDKENTSNEQEEPFEMENIYKYLKLKVVYPDNRVDYIHIPRSDYKMLSANRLKIETNVYLASDKAWTDPSNVDFSVVFNLDYTLENIHIVNELGIEDWMEYLPLTSPTRLFVQPRAIGNK